MPLPLHIFEPRYLKMVRDAWEGARVIGMMLLRPGWESSYYGRPAVYPVGCAGLMVECQALEGGRYNIVLRGLAPFRVLDEHPGEPYRLAEVEYRHETMGEAKAIADSRGRVLALLGESVEGVLAVREDVPNDVFVNALCQGLELSPLERQSLLECESIEGRSARLLEILEFRRLDRHAPGSPPTLH